MGGECKQTMLNLSNEEIREKLLELNYNCGPVTNTTREIYIKKLEALRAKSQEVKKTQDDKLTDRELRSQLISFGQSVAPITETNRHIYLKRLQKLKNRDNVSSQKGDSCNNSSDDLDFCEPMDID